MTDLPDEQATIGQPGMSVDTLIHDLLAAAASQTDRIFARTPHGTYTFEIAAVEGRNGVVMLSLRETDASQRGQGRAELGGAVGRSASAECKHGKHDQCVDLACKCRHHGRVIGD